MRLRRHAFGILIPICAAAVACGLAGVPTPPVAARATNLAQTAAALLTATAAARATLATLTPMPSTTPSATATVSPGPQDTPTATRVPASQSVSPTPCENDSDFVSDVNVPDGTHFAQGASFVKTWRLRNSGTCAWTTAYTFRPVAGEALSGTNLSLPDVVPVGATVDLSVSLTTPNRNGTFTGEWQLHSPGGAAFGTKPFVQIVVP